MSNPAQVNRDGVPPMKKSKSMDRALRSDSPTENMENSRFSKPFDYSDNVVFQVEGRLVHVSKVIVCANSPMFDAMLNGDFSEKNKLIIPLADDSYGDFINLITIIHPPLQKFRFTSNNIVGLVHLADKYQMSVVLKTREEYFLAHVNPTVEGLVLAQNYKLSSYMTQCIAKICKTLTKHKIVSNKGLSLSTQIELIKARASLIGQFFNQGISYTKKESSMSSKIWLHNCKDVQELLKQNPKKQFPKAISSISTRPLLNFSRPWRWNNVIVQVQGRQIHVCKPVLCHNSSVLKHMLDNAVNEEIHVDDSDVKYDDFIVLMNIVHPPVKLDAITGTNVNAVARLANQYDMRNIVDVYEQYMIEDDADYTYQTLLTAQQCHMTELLQHSIDSLSRHQTLKQMISCREFASFHDQTILNLLAKSVEHFENLFEQITVHFNGREYNIDNWHTCL